MAEIHETEPKERYEIRSKIGEGGIGAVYLAYDRALKREVAIKRLLPQGEKPEEERYHAEEIVREAGALSKLQHPNVVTVFDAGIDDDGGFVVMELIDGETVDQTLSRGALTYDDFRSFVEQALEGLIAAQDIDMLHRDIKPSNVMVHWLPSGKFQLKLLDFGLARVTQKPQLQTVRHGDSILGSIYFMAPEQFEREPLDQRTDIYSLGCLFYYMLAGAYPFDGEVGGEVMVKKLEHDVQHLFELRPDVPRPVCDWVMRMLAREREDRPETAKMALDEFDAAAELAEQQLAKENRNPLLAPALVGNQAPAAAQPATGTAPTMAVPGASAAPMHKTSYYMQRPAAAQKSNAGVAFAAALVVLACGVGGWFVFTQMSDASEEDEPPGNDYELADASDDPDLTEPEKPEPEEVPAATTKVGEERWPSSDSVETLVASDALWRFWDKGAVPSTNWRGTNFDDSEWGQGPGPLGYGEKDGVHATEISFGGDPKKKHVTYLFRHTFESEGANAYKKLWLRFRVDDGCIVYLNANEICRLGMGDKQWPATNQLAERMADANRGEKAYHTFELDERWRLQAGKNTIAIRVHQVKRTSSDLGIEFEMVGKKK